MKNSMEVKMQVLDMLKDFLMGTEGEKLKPKSMSVEVMTAKPMKDKEGLEEVLEKASKKNPVDDDEMGEPIDMDGDGDHDEDDHEMAEDCDDEEKPKMTLKEFLKTRK